MSVRLPLPFRPSGAMAPQKAGLVMIQEACERFSERLFHPSAKAETVEHARADLLALLAEIEVAAAEALDRA